MSCEKGNNGSHFRFKFPPGDCRTTYTRGGVMLALQYITTSVSCPLVVTSAIYFYRGFCWLHTLCLPSSGNYHLSGQLTQTAAQCCASNEPTSQTLAYCWCKIGLTLAGINHCALVVMYLCHCDAEQAMYHIEMSSMDDS